MSETLHVSNSLATGAEGPCLLVVGTGIEAGSHPTLAAQRAIEQASKVLFAVADAWTVRWIRGLRPDAESMSYGTPDTPRHEIYRAMTEKILGYLRQGHRVCAVFYGHPGVLADAAHAAIERARAEGFTARMLPGVSSLDCLFADLGLDPGRRGCQLYEAQHFITRSPSLDVHTPLLLLQPSMVGSPRAFDASDTTRSTRGLARLQEALSKLYPSTHGLIMYCASTDCSEPPHVQHVALADLHTARVLEAATLFVPAIEGP